MKKLRVGLFIGGSSSEKEISLESGRHVYNNLDREKYEVVPLFVDSHHHFWQIPEALMWKNTTKDLEDSVHLTENLSHETANVNNSVTSQRVWWEDLNGLIDFAFICLHGKFGEDAILGLFEILNIPNNGASVLGGALSMDKNIQRQVLVAAGLNVPCSVSINIYDWNVSRERVIAEVEGKIGYPFMIKPSREGSSTALKEVRSLNEVDAAFSEAFEYDNVILAEEVLEGMELTCLVYGTNDDIKALPPSQLLKGGDFLTAEEKFLPGGAQMITPPPVSEDLIRKIQEESIKVFKALGLKIYSRIDSFLVGPGLLSFEGGTIHGSLETANVNSEGKTGDEYRVVILEPNNPPAMTPSTAIWLQASEAGFNTSQFIDELINISLKAHEDKLGPL